MPRVLFVLTGGTISMKSGKGGVMRVKDEARDFIAEVPALARIADIETKALFRLDSADMQPEHWITLAREIHGALASKKYDGIVVVHGTDTMAYTASALALLLGPVPKPVVLTGAQKPLVEARTDGRENLINATLAATLAVPEVSVAFAARVLRGVRTTKHSAWALDAFDSPNAPPLVELGLGVSVGSHVRKPGKLPWRTHVAQYALEYGTDQLEIHVDALAPGQRVLIVDDVLATGGTAAATVGLVEGRGATVVGLGFLVELDALGGRARLGGHRCDSLVRYG